MLAAVAAGGWAAFALDPDGDLAVAAAGTTACAVAAAAAYALGLAVARSRRLADDLERAQQALSLQAGRVRERQEQVLKEVEERIDAEARRLDAEGKVQRET